MNFRILFVVCPLPALVTAELELYAVRMFLFYFVVFSHAYFVFSDKYLTWYACSDLLAPVLRRSSRCLWVLLHSTEMGW